ncbi:MAG: hypothetical protein Q7K20_07540 [Polaromonas sp.]|jgi:hypothetical protein|nr:hypothetical protein [Polaromonas sp.]
MYQELQLFEESFDRRPVWGTEGTQREVLRNFAEFLALLALEPHG